MGWLSDRIVRWQRAHGRSELPWQGTRDPYRIWVSEIMLQQTQVAAVIRYFERFVARFPDVHALARAQSDDVMRLWSGLGYYGRARNLHECARRLVDEFDGEFPRSAGELAKLPGIGRSSGAAIAAFAFGARAPILDGNVRRVLCRVFAVEGYPGRGPVERRLWEIAERELPRRAIETYTQGMMDLGATLCTRSRPACLRCPLRARCLAYAHGRVAELPSARPRRALASRATSMLILRRGDDVLLERRPPSGIWGGLWSLPQFDADPPSDGAQMSRSTLEAAVARSGHRLLSHRALPSFEHMFTHLRLRVEPMLAVVATSRSERVRDAPGEIWLALADTESAALPAPVKSLLLRLRDG